MANKLQNSVIVSKRSIQQKGGVVILPLKEYEKLSERAIPTYYLSGKKAEEADRMVEEGLKEHREGKTIKANSLKEAIRKYGKKSRS